MAACMIPKVCLAVQLSPGIWCQLNVQNDGIGATLKKDQDKYPIPAAIWEALLDKVDLVQRLDECILRQMS